MQYRPTAVELSARGAAQAALHERAAEVARRVFEQRVFVRAVVEISNFCRENCAYCGMRRDNRALARARARHDEIADLLTHHRPASVTDVNLQAGEDPVAAREIALPLVRTLRRETALGISICLGTLDHAIYQELKAAGATVYILKFETADPGDYDRQEAPGDLAERLAHIRWLAGNGWKVSSGFIAGLPGQGVAEVLENLRLASALPVQGCSVSPFVPGDETPLADAAPGDLETTLNCMAILRLMRPDWVVPAVSALDLAPASGGYRRGLQAGANLVTINLTPRDLRRDYLIYKRDRIIMDEECILSAVEVAGLTPSSQGLADFLNNGAAARAAAVAAAMLD